MVDCQENRRKRLKALPGDLLAPEAYCSGVSAPEGTQHLLL